MMTKGIGLVLVILLVTVSVASAIYFVNVPDDRIIVYGADLYLHCSVVDPATGNADGLSIRWMHNNNPLNPKSLTYPNGTLFIPATVEADKGLYRCFVYNDTNSDLLLTSDPALVFKASFHETPKDDAVVFEKDLFLNCSVSPLPSGTSESVTIQWNLNEAPTSPKVSLFSNGTLLVPSLSEKDMGNYTCLVLDSKSNIVLRSKPALVFYAYSKMFVVNPVQVWATEGQPVSFDCITGESAPPPEIFWERDGVRFNGGEQFNATYGGYSADSLVMQYSMKLIMRAKPYLDGAYNCVARNPALHSNVRSLKVRLHTAELESAPYVIEEQVQTEMITALGQPLTIDCPIAGKPQVTYTWYKDGVSIDGVYDYFTLRNGSLNRGQAGLEDEAWYFCKGTNTLGIILSPNISVVLARIDIGFLEAPDDLYMIAGLPATLKCAPPPSVPIATVTWYKDNALLIPRTGEQSMTVQTTSNGYWNIEFREIQKQDEGEYFCVAKNKFAVPTSRTSRTAMVRVGGAPIFVEPPIGLTIEKGKLAQLTCYVQGDPFPEVTWLFEDSVLIAAEYISFRQGKQELWIGDINKGNEGTYTCRAVNRYGTIQNRVYVKVLVPPVVLQPVGDQVVSKGETVIIPCGIYSDPAATITWFKDSAAVELSGRFTQLPDGLYITSVTVEDSGTYICQATNMAGSVENQGTLKVLVLPYFTEKPKSQIVNLGKNVSLSCAASGYPKPQVTWLFNESSLFPKDSLLSLDQGTLLLLEVSWLHVGIYTCLARNDQGTSRITATVKVRVPPKVTQIVGIPLLYQGEHLQLRCLVTGIPEPLVEWFFNREPVVETNNGRITLPGQGKIAVKYVTDNDAGVYTCKGTNAAGVNQMDLDVHIVTRPSPPSLYAIETISATSIKLTWSIEQRVPQTPVDRVLLSYRKKLQSTSPYTEIELDASFLQYIIDDLDPASEYVFMVSAINGAGTSDISNILAARTFDSGPSDPRNVDIQSVGSRSALLMWEIPYTTNGMIRKYQLKYWERGFRDDAVKLQIPSDNNPSHDYVIEGLKPYTWYSLQIRAATMEGDQVLWGNWSASLDLKTEQAAPNGTARELRALPLSPNIIQVFWEAVLQEKQNGPIKRYYVQYWLLSNLTRPLGEEVVESLDLQVNITDLDPWTWYVFKVTPENTGGLGQPSVPITARTFPTAPTGAPLDVTAEGHTDSSILVSWKPPLDEDWNSDISGFIIEYWNPEAGLKSMTTIGMLDLSAVIRGLEPFTVYEMRVAAFTNQISNGMGPYSDNVTARTMQAEPGSIKDFSFKATSTTLKLSWKHPTVTNGIISHFLVTYHLIGPATVTTPTPESSQPIIAQHVNELLNDTDSMDNIFDNFQESLTSDLLSPLAELCDFLFRNETMMDNLENVTDISQSEYLLQFNVSEVITDWMVIGDRYIGTLCDELLLAVLAMEPEDTGPVQPSAEIFNETTTATSLKLTGLQSDSVYNVSVTAATEAGYGPVARLDAATLKVEPTPRPTIRPTRPATSRPTTAGSPMGEEMRSELERNLPVIIGGSVSGFILLLIIFFTVCCIFVRRRRAHSEEKDRVLRQESLEEPPPPQQHHNTIYGELDRPRAPAMASAAEDGTDSVDFFTDEVRFHSPKPRNSVATMRSFMTEGSGHMPISSHGRRVKEAFLGMENPSYSGLSAPGSVKNNPAYYEEAASSSDQESMSVTMALSSEDMSFRRSQVSNGTLKRKNRMKSIDAAAIARLRSNNLPSSMVSENDRSALINNDIEVVFNERTAL